jgi:hypothetical protein
MEEKLASSGRQNEKASALHGLGRAKKKGSLVQKKMTIRERPVLWK